MQLSKNKGHNPNKSDQSSFLHKYEENNNDACFEATLSLPLPLRKVKKIIRPRTLIQLGAAVTKLVEDRRLELLTY